MDWIISTGANLYHDLHYGLGMELYAGSPFLDDVQLRHEGIIRIYDVLFDYDVLLDTDAFVRQVIQGLEFQRTMGTDEFHFLLGRYVHERERKLGLRETSLVSAAFRYGVPIFTSSPGDSSIGMNVAAMALRDSKLQYDVNRDVNQTAAIVYDAKSSERREAGLLLTHHPLIYRPLEEIREDQAQGSLLARLIRAGMAAATCHTNLDVAPGGLNDYLARLLELTQVEPLAEVGSESHYKLTVFVPEGYEAKVRAALCAEGAGIISNYSHCSFAARGQGTYLPHGGARPFKGQVADLSRAEESRLEVLTRESRISGAVARLKAAHP